MPEVKATARDCSGCYNDFYNGRNPYGVKECWHLKDAEMGKFLLIPVDMCPPYQALKDRTLPTCYRMQRFVKVKREALTPSGYWRT